MRITGKKQGKFPFTTLIVPSPAFLCYNSAISGTGVFSCSGEVACLSCSASQAALLPIGGSSMTSARLPHAGRRPSDNARPSPRCVPHLSRSTPVGAAAVMIPVMVSPAVTSQAVIAPPADSCFVIAGDRQRSVPGQSPIWKRKTSSCWTAKRPD